MLACADDRSLLINKDFRSWMHSVASATEQRLEQIAKRFDKMTCAGGVNVLLSSLKPTVYEPMMTELIASCTERR